MSFETWHDYGFGFCVDNITTTAEKINKLISYAPEFEKVVKEYFSNLGILNPSMEDFEDLDQDFMNGLAYIIVEVIMEAEDILLLHTCDYNGCRYVILTPSYPWAKVSEKHKNLTLNSLTDIYKKYISILTDEEIDLDYQSVENCG